MKYDARTHGRGSRQAPSTEALKWEWETADQLNADRPGQGEWVPRRTIFTRPDISPRVDANRDHELVSHYASIFHLLPPIRVQRDTFVLIDGAHRLAASFETAASTEHIRIVEVDVPEEELWLAAFDANAEHGRSLTTAERVTFAKKLMKAYPGWSDSRVAERAGIDRKTVMRYRPRPTNPDAPIVREGRDGKTYERAPQVVQKGQPEPDAEPKAEPRKPFTIPPRTPVSTFEPDPEPVYEGEGWDAPGRTDVDKGTGELIDTGAGGDGTPAVAPPPRIRNFLGIGDAAADYLAHLRAAASTADEIIAEIAANRPASSEARLYLSALADHLASLAVKE